MCSCFKISKRLVDVFCDLFWVFVCGVKWRSHLRSNSHGHRNLHFQTKQSSFYLNCSTNRSQKSTRSPNSSNKVLIQTDSLTLLEFFFFLKTQKTTFLTTRTRITNQINAPLHKLHALNITTTIMWILNHCSITGNEHVDKGTNYGTTHGKQLHSPLHKTEIQQLINMFKPEHPHITLQNQMHHPRKSSKQIEIKLNKIHTKCRPPPNPIHAPIAEQTIQYHHFPCEKVMHPLKKKRFLIFPSTQTSTKLNPLNSYTNQKQTTSLNRSIVE